MESEQRQAHSENALVRILSYSKKPWVCLSSAFIGMGLGLNFARLGELLSPLGNIYITLLTLTVTPIIFCALASGLCKLMTSEDGKRYLPRIAATLALGTLMAGFLGTFAGAVVLPFLTHVENRDFIGQTLSKFEEGMAASGQSLEGSSGFWAFIGKLIPSNVLETLSSENLLSVVFLATLFGMALCEVSSRKREVAIDFIDAMYDTFLTVLDWVLYLLPLGLFCLMASQAAKVGGSAIKAMLAIIALYMSCFAIMTALYLFALRRSTGRSLKEVLAALKQTFTLAFVASADSALPSAMTQMAKLGLPRNLLSSVIPLSAATNRHATAIMFAIIAFFVADVYDVNLNLWQTLFVALGCAIVGAFDSGEYVTIAPMIAYVLIPLGLPAAPGIAIILTIWPMIEWFAELQTIMAACSNAAVIANVGADKPGKAT